MATQQEIAEHLDLSQPEVSEGMKRLGIDWRVTPLDDIRVAYIRRLRFQAAGHMASDGTDLVRERVMTERVDRELKQLTLAEKRGVLVNVEQLEPELLAMVGAFRAELLARDDKLAQELQALYGVTVDVAVLNEHTYAALAQLSRYDPGGPGADAEAGARDDSAGADVDHGLGAPASPAVGEG